MPCGDYPLRIMLRTRRFFCRQQERLLTAYLGEIVDLTEFERKRRELDQKMASLRAQHQQLEALASQRRELQQIAASLETFCSQVRTGLEAATFEQKRQLVELLVDQVVVTDEDVDGPGHMTVDHFGKAKFSTRCTSAC